MPKSKRRMPKRTITLDLSAEGFDDFHCETWMNPPLAFSREYDAYIAVHSRLVALRLEALRLRKKKRKNADDRKRLEKLEGKLIPDLEDGFDEKKGAEILLDLFPDWDLVDWKGNDIPHTAEGLDYIMDDVWSAMWKCRARAISEKVMPAPLEESSSDTPSGLAEASTPLTS